MRWDEMGVAMIFTVHTKLKGPFTSSVCVWEERRADARCRLEMDGWMR